MFCFSPFQSSFVVDEVSNIIKESVESAIGGNAYQHNKVNQWTTNVVEQTLSQLTKLGKPFKYIVTCVIMQKNGAGLHTASSCFWDNSTDGSCTVRWENKTMYCIVSAFGLAIWPFSSLFQSWNRFIIICILLCSHFKMYCGFFSFT